MVGVTERAVRKAIETGRLERSVQYVAGKPTIADPVLAAKEWTENRDPSRSGSGTRSETIEAARKRQLDAQADKLELQNMQKRGELLSAEEVKASWSRRVIAYREASLNLAARLIQRGMVAREHEAALNEEIDTTLKQLAERT